MLFAPATSAVVGPRRTDRTQAKDLRRLELFIALLDRLCCTGSTRPLPSENDQPDPSGLMSAGINETLAFINANLTEPFSKSDLAAIAG